MNKLVFASMPIVLCGLFFYWIFPAEFLDGLFTHPFSISFKDKIKHSDGWRAGYDLNNVLSFLLCILIPVAAVFVTVNVLLGNIKVPKFPKIF